jgi:lipooligosaccharide transport system permease protein
VAEALPLTHLVKLARGLTLGALKPELLWSVLYLVVFVLVFFPLALVSMRKRLIN